VLYTANNTEKFEGGSVVIVLKQVFAIQYSCLAEMKSSVIKSCSTPSTIRPCTQNATAIRTAQDMFSDNEIGQELLNFSAGVPLYVF
jgi:hypothetical protein